MGSFFLGLVNHHHVHQMYGSETLGLRDMGFGESHGSLMCRVQGTPWPSPLNHGSGYWHNVYAHSSDQGHDRGSGDGGGSSGGDG